MQLLRNFFLVTADAELNSTLPIKGINGEFLMLDTKFDPLRHSTRLGRVSSAPLEFSDVSIDSNILKVKDKVLFHHFVCQEQNKWIIDGKTYYKAIWEHVWAKVEFDQLIPLNEWLFVEPILEDESALFCDTIKLKEDAENIPNTGIVFASSTYCKSLGINTGNKIHFIKNADYEIKVGDKDLWRMKANAVIVIEKDGEVYPLEGSILVEQDEQPDRVYKAGLILPESNRAKELTGTVVNIGNGQFFELVSKFTTLTHGGKLYNSDDVIGVGGKVTYFRGMFGNFNFKGKNYSALKPTDILYVN